MRRLLPALPLAAALAGCTVGPDYRAPPAAVPPAYSEPQAHNAASVDAATWWRAWGDPVLDRLVDAALLDNPDMATAASRVREARLSEIQARAVGRPTLDATGSVTHLELSKNAGISQLASQFGGGASGGGTGGGAGGTGGGQAGGITLPGGGITTYALGFDASWELDLFGGGRRGVEAARARTQAAEWNRADAQVTLAAEVAQAYFTLRYDQVQLDVLNGELARQRRALQIAQNVARVGLQPQVDTTRQRQQITTTQAQLEPVAADIRLRAHALAILVGRAPGALPPELGGALDRPAALAPAPAVPAGLPSDLLRRRPDVRAAERQLAAANADIGVAVADLYPRFSLTGVGELISSALSNLFSGNSLQATGTGSVDFPLFDSGNRRAAVGIRREEREQAYQSWRGTVLGALRDVEDALAQLDSERRRNDTLVRAVNDALATERSVRAQYTAGLVAQNSLLDAETTVLQARQQLAGSDAQLRQQTAALFKALGGGWRPDMAVPPRPER